MEGHKPPNVPMCDCDLIKANTREGELREQSSQPMIDDMKDSATAGNRDKNVGDAFEEDLTRFKINPRKRENYGNTDIISTCAAKYDVFFSHAREDRNWVTEVLNKLESPEYGFKCCFADRDFELGRSVFDNITRSIQASAKTVIVLSPEFLSSDWCEYEIRMTLEADSISRKRILIPVMLRPCRVPDFIGRLTYIEVENEHFWERFISALKQNNSRDFELDQTQAGNYNGTTLLQSPFHRNLDKLVKIDVSETHCWLCCCCCCCCCSDSSRDFVPKEISGSIIAGDFQGIMEILKEQQFVKRHPFFTFTFWVVLIVGSFMFSIIMPILIAILDHQTNFLLLLVLPIILFPVVVCLFSSIRFACGFHTARNFNRALRRANEISIRYNLMVGYKTFGCCNGCQCNKFKIIFYFYDWRLCLAHFREHQRCSEEWNCNSDLSDVNAAEIHPIASNDPTEDFAEESLMAYVPEYLELFVKKKLTQPMEERHVRHCECLCQFAESLEAQNKDCMTRVLGVKSRRPFKRISDFLV